MNFQSNESPENKVVVLETVSDSPKSKLQDFKVGDKVAVIKDNGVFDVSGRIEEVCEKLVFAATVYRGRDSTKQWMSVELARNLHSVEKIVDKGFKVGIGEGRFSRSEWFPPEQIFFAPWANAAKLKVGNTVYRIRFGDFKPDKGVITALPVSNSGSFKVRFDGWEKDDWVDREDIFSSIESAADEKLSIGDIVYFDKLYWAIIVGKRDGKIVIREAGFPARDKIVDVSKLQILK